MLCGWPYIQEDTGRKQKIGTWKGDMGAWGYLRGMKGVSRIKIHCIHV